MVKKSLYYITMTGLIGIMIFSGARIYKIKNNYYWAEYKLNKIRAAAEINNKENNDKINNLNWKEINKKYPNIIAWMKSDIFDLPIVKSKDNEEYLYLTANKEYSIYGTPFVDCHIENPFKTNLTIIYGHNTLDGTMFAPINKYYYEEGYLEEHKYITLYTPEQVYNIEIFATDQIDGVDSEYYNYQVKDIINYTNKINNKKIKINKLDKIIMFSTCTPEGSNKTNKRTVIWGKLNKNN